MHASWHAGENCGNTFPIIFNIEILSLISLSLKSNFSLDDTIFQIQYIQIQLIKHWWDIILI